VKALVLALVVAWSVGAPSSLGSGVASDRFENQRLGHTLLVPSDWQGSVRPKDGVTVITSLPVPNRNDNPERIRLSRGDVYIWIFDYGPVLASGSPARPARIELGKKRMHSCGFGEGYSLHFRDRGDLVQVFVKLGPFTGKQAVLAVLNSLRVRR
jgi:hypothetical protein